MPARVPAAPLAVEQHVDVHAAPAHVDVHAAPHVDLVEPHLHAAPAHAHQVVEHHAPVEQHVHVDTHTHVAAPAAPVMVPAGAHQVYDVVGMTKMKKIPVKPGLRGRLFGPKVRAPVWKDIKIRPGGMKQDFAPVAAAAPPALIPQRSVSAHADRRIVHQAPIAHGTLAPPAGVAGRYEYPAAHVDVAHHGHAGDLAVHQPAIMAAGAGQVDFDGFMPETHVDIPAAGGTQFEMHGTCGGTEYAPTVDLSNGVATAGAPYAPPGVQGGVYGAGVVTDAPASTQVPPETVFVPGRTNAATIVNPLHDVGPMAPPPPSPGAPNVRAASAHRRSRAPSANPMRGGSEASIMA